MGPAVVLVGSRDRQIEEALRGASLVVTPISEQEFESQAAAGRFSANVLVIDLRDRDALPTALAVVRRRQPGLGIVIVASKLDPALMLEAMRGGVNEFLAQPVTPEDLNAAIHRVAAPVREAVAGSVFAFVGAKGGVGTTTTAINVASSLAATAPGRTLVMDLHPVHGDAALFLGAEPRFSVLDALENSHRLDESFFRGLVVRTKCGADLLASSDRAATSLADPSRVRALIAFAAGLYQYVVLDVPRSDTASLESLELARKVVVVANQELATVKSAARIAAMLRQRYGKQRVGVIITRYDTQAEIGHDDVERVVGESVKHLLPSDYRAALKALNAGHPLVLGNHSKLAGSLTGFARDLAGLGGAQAEESRSTGLFSRFTGRRS